MKRLFLFLLVLSCGFVKAQSLVSGIVTDAASGEPLVNAVVVVNDGKIFTLTDFNGAYHFSLADGTYTLSVKYVGYTCVPVTVKVSGKSVSLDFQCSSGNLKEVEVIADVAIDRKTPVAFTTLSPKQIHEELNGRDLTMMLNSTPGAYASEQGGGAGDSRVNIRGVDQRNVGVLVDGVPVNDMENGQVYWSNWDGLSDITRTMQVQRGLGASKLAIPSVGGTINILTNGIDEKRGYSVSSTFGSDNLQKFSFGFNSGEFA
ncbi:MAG TPA: carboxypeptidase-like regulatory domain-containing protein, partial [Bacteroidia bacterium]|nr:carboxypeptidase-like regulatory domain-containing protein [Bacteroidia bacterium]